MTRTRIRCPWPGEHEFYIRYHDEEWGVPLHDDRKLFEFLVLEGAQAGLSWATILRKREAYRRAFAGFDPAKVARFGARDVRRLLGDAGIVRNRAKIAAAVANARAFLEVQREFGSFDRYIWGFVAGKPIRNRRRSLSHLPARTPLSDRISGDLRARGFRFVGPTIVYAHMQATGMVNDHLVSCFRWREVDRQRGSTSYGPGEPSAEPRQAPAEGAKPWGTGRPST
jgi:DNA-3-methyladenine glycosylase I